MPNMGTCNITPKDIIAVWCVGDFKHTTVLAKPVLHCGECAVHFGLIKSCEQKHCGYQRQVAKAAMPMAGPTNEP